MTFSKIFSLSLFFFIFGIFQSSFLNSPFIFLFAFLILNSLLILSIIFLKKEFLIFAIFLLFFLFGIWRHQLAIFLVKEDFLQKINDTKKEIGIVGTILAEPEFTKRTQKLVVLPQKIFYQGEIIEEKIRGKILVRTKKFPTYQYGDQIKILGKLQSPPKNIGGFNYRDYLQKDGIYSLISFPKIEILKRKNYPNISSLFLAQILNLKNILEKVIDENLPFSQAAILKSLILGEKKEIPRDLKEKLNLSGLRHITAISGLHVTILTSILLNLFLALGLWRRQALLSSFFFIFLFVLMTGLQSSAIRASIMGGLFLLSQYFGRENVSSRSLIFAASIMLFQNPLLLKSDVGFQLSFLAMIGIIFWTPIFRRWFNFFLKEKFVNFKGILAMTFSAQIFTLPILLYNFGYFSFVTPITNVLVLPILPFILGLGFLFSLTGAIFQALGQILSFPLWLLLNYLLRIVEFFSQNSLVYKISEKLSLSFLLFFYLILGILTWRLKEREKLKFLQY